MKKKLIKLNKNLIVVKNSKIHGRGVYAKKNIPKGTYLLEYLGEKISKEDGTKREIEQRKNAKKNGTGADYIFYLNKKYDIDGNFEYNIARLVNHSCSPNCEFIVLRDRVFISSKKEININEELTINYGYDDLENYHLHVCKCGKENCIGYIIDEDYRNKLEKKIKNEKKRKNK